MWIGSDCLVATAADDVLLKNLLMWMAVLLHVHLKHDRFFDGLFFFEHEVDDRVSFLRAQTAAVDTALHAGRIVVAGAEAVADVPLNGFHSAVGQVDMGGTAAVAHIAADVDAVVVVASVASSSGAAVVVAFPDCALKGTVRTVMGHRCSSLRCSSRSCPFLPGLPLRVRSATFRSARLCCTRTRPLRGSCQSRA